MFNNVAFSAFRWGADLINGIVNGIKRCTECGAA